MLAVALVTAWVPTAAVLEDQQRLGKGSLAAAAGTGGAVGVIGSEETLSRRAGNSGCAGIWSSSAISSLSASNV